MKMPINIIVEILKIGNGPNLDPGGHWNIGNLNFLIPGDPGNIGNPRILNSGGPVNSGPPDIWGPGNLGIGVLQCFGSCREHSGQEPFLEYVPENMTCLLLNIGHVWEFLKIRLPRPNHYASQTRIEKLCKNPVSKS